MDGTQGAEVYFNDQYYYAFYSSKNIDIYSTKFVNLVQVFCSDQILDVSNHDVVTIKSSFVKPALFALTRKAVLVFSPYYSVYGTINFRRIHTEQLSAEFSSMDVAASGDYLVLTNLGKHLSTGDCRILQVSWQSALSEDPQAIDGLNIVSKIKFAEDIRLSNLSNGKPPSCKTMPSGQHKAVIKRKFSYGTSKQ
jgi:hypothetical protein